jgi:hypothetical protein
VLCSYGRCSTLLLCGVLLGGVLIHMPDSSPPTNAIGSRTVRCAGNIMRCASQRSALLVGCAAPFCSLVWLRGSEACHGGRLYSGAASALPHASSSRVNIPLSISWLWHSCCGARNWAACSASWPSQGTVLLWTLRYVLLSGVLLGGVLIHVQDSSPPTNAIGSRTQWCVLCRWHAPQHSALLVCCAALSCS